MQISDQRMLELIEILKGHQVIRFEREFCLALELKQPNLVRIKQGKAHFTPEHIARAVKKFGVDANWVLGIGREIFLKQKQLQ